MYNYKAKLVYDGRDLSGWQRQKNTPSTIQENLEEALARITKERVKIIGAGRTDAGVHALDQVCNFILTRQWQPNDLVRALNDHIHPNIAVISIEAVSPSFNALRDAELKWYRYRILNRSVRCPFRKGYVYFCPFPLNSEAMQKAASFLKGEHNFTSFCAARSTAVTKVRRLDELDVYRAEDEIILDFKAKGFLYKMVRNITGTLVQVGKGRVKPEDIPVILEKEDRTAAGPTAPAYGLTLMQVDY